MYLDISGDYQLACRGEKTAEDRLFAFLRERFRVFLQQRVRSRDDLEDLLQETLTVIARKYKVEPIENIGAWAYRVMENTLLNYYRQKKHRSAREQTEAVADAAPAAAPDYQLRLDLQDCLERLHAGTPRYAKILSLHYQGYTTEEICRAMTMNRNALYILLSRARRILRECLDGKRNSNERM